MVSPQSSGYIILMNSVVLVSVNTLLVTFYPDYSHLLSLCPLELLHQLTQR